MQEREERKGGGTIHLTRLVTKKLEANQGPYLVKVAGHIKGQEDHVKS